MAIPVARRFQCYCDAEHDVGLVANDSSDRVAARNTVRLNAALNNQRTSGAFRALDGKTSPVVYPIQFSAKQFFFADPVVTPVRIGGAMFGSGGRSYPMVAPLYDIDSVGGAVTRLTWIDGAPDSTCIRLRGCGFTIGNIQINGRPYDADQGAGEGPGSGTKAHAGIEIEGRGSPVATGGHAITNCLISDCTNGVLARAGYYNDAGVFVSDENHADTSTVSNTIFYSNVSCFRSESQQALDWRFYNMAVSCWGGAGQVPTTVFDFFRGGNVQAYGVTLLHPQATLLSVDNYSPWANRFDIHGVYRDRYASNAEYYLTLFKYAGEGFPTAEYLGDSSFLDWSVRVTGNLPQTGGEYDTSRLIDITPGSVNFPLDDLLFDVKRMPTDDFESVGGGYWKPTTAWLS